MALHGAKVADGAGVRIGRDEDFRILREDELKIVLVADASPHDGL
jgi:hypothetical protein